MGSDALRLGR